MRIEIPVQDLQMAIQFARSNPPKGVKVSLPPAREFNSALPQIASHAYHVILEVAENPLIKLLVPLLAGWILSRFQKCRKQPPIYITVNEKKVKLKKFKALAPIAQKRPASRNQQQPKPKKH